MIRRSNFLIGITIVVLGLILAIPAHGQEYQIKLVRPFKVGDQFKTEIKASVKRVVRLAPSNSTGELSGTVKVLAANEKTGGITELTCTIDKFTMDGKEPYPAGAVIAGKKSNHVTSFTINGQAASKEEKSLFLLMFSIADPDATVSDDRVFGVEQPQKVGAAWPINAETAAKGLTESDMPISSTAIKGKSVLLNVSGSGSTATMIIQSTLSGRQLDPHTNGKVSVVGGSFALEQEMEAPVDVLRPLISMTAKTRLTETFASRTGEFQIIEDAQLTRHDQPIK